MDLDEKLAQIVKQLPSASILIVEDDEVVSLSLEAVLESKQYELCFARSGQQALELLQQRDFTVVISDYMLPDMTGIELLREVSMLRPGTGRVLITGHGDYELAINSINQAQVQSFIAKPWNNQELEKHIEEIVERQALLKESNHLQRILASQHQHLSDSNAKMARQMDLGARVHDVLLTSHPPTEFCGLEIASITLASREVDGDFNDFFTPFDNTLDLVFGDVMGKGLPAALVGTAMKAQVMRFALPTTKRSLYRRRHSWSHDILPVHEIVRRIHGELAEKFIELEVFSTLFYARFHTEQAVLSYIDCGTTKPLLFRPKTKEFTQLASRCFPIGVVTSDIFEERTIAYQVGDLLLFFSDGLTEARHPDGALFGEERLRLWILDHPDLSVQEIVGGLRKQVQEFTQSATLDDDLTLIAVRVKSLPPLVEKELSAAFSSDLSQLTSLRDFVARSAGQAFGEDSPLVSQLQLAVNEAFCNIVNHSYGGKTDERIEVHCRITRDEISFEIRDFGQPFDPKAVHAPDLSGNTYNGFGVFLMQQIADELCYSQKSDADQTPYNSLTIHKNIHPSEDVMNLDHTITDGVLVVTLLGEQLDAQQAPEFKEQVLDLIQEGNHLKVVLDMTQLQFIDSSGLGSLLSALRQVNTGGGDLRLAHLSPPVRTMFEIVRMHKLFEIYPSVDAAVSSYSGRATQAGA